MKYTIFWLLQEAARRYTDTSWHIFNQGRKNVTQQTKKKSNGNTYQKLESTDDIQTPPSVNVIKNASISKSIDTSPNSEEMSPQSRETSPKCGEISLKSHDLKPTEVTTSENESASSLLYEKIGKPELNQFVKIETVEVFYEPISRQTRSVSLCSTTFALLLIY